jgi:serine/threonine protein kinase
MKESQAPEIALHPIADGSGETPPPSRVAGGTSVIKAELAASLLPPLKLQKLKHYELLELVGRGGMGDVYRARDEQSNRIVAVKALSPELTRDDQFVRRFEREARALAKLEHPNIVPVYDIDRDQGHVFYVMQFVAGESLDRRLRRAGKPTLNSALRIIADCTRALSTAHDQRLIHRDVKPGNVLLQEGNDHVYLVDFGLVRRVDSNTAFTETGVVMGTVDYMSPEQARGSANIDHRADLYSIGVMLYHLLSGRLPFESPSFQGMLYSHAYDTPPPIADIVPDLPPPLVDLVSRLLTKAPGDRPANCREVLATLEPLLRLDVRAQQLDAECKQAAQPDPSNSRVAELGRRERWPNRLISAFGVQSPKAIKEMQATKEEFDAELLAVEKRLAYLQELKAEGELLCAELRQQADEFGQDEKREAASFCDHAESLAQRLPQIARELGQIQVLRAKLSNGRDAIASRLKFADRKTRRKNSAILGFFAASVATVLLVAVALWYSHSTPVVAEPPRPSKDGRHLLLAEHQWTAALSKLAIESDPLVAAAAQEELANPNTVEQHWRAADAWWNASEAEADPNAKNAFLALARTHYSNVFKLQGNSTGGHVRDRAGQLLQNGGCEQIGHSDQVPHWVAIRGGFTRREQNPTAREGKFYFAPLPVAVAEIEQTVSIASLASPIDANRLDLRFRGNVRSYKQARPDEATVIVELLDADGQVLESFNSGIVPSTDAWKFVSDARPIPPGTRSVKMRLISTRHEGTNNDGYFDDLSLRAVFRDEKTPKPSGGELAMPVAAEAHFEAGNAAKLRGDLALARREYEAGLRIDPSNLYEQGSLAVLCLALDDAAAYQEHCRSLLVNFTKPHVQGDHRAKLAILRAVTLDSRGAPDFTQFKITKEDVEYAYTWAPRTRIALHYRSGRWNETIADAMAYLAQRSGRMDDIQPMLFSAMAHWQIDQKDSAKQLLETADRTFASLQARTTDRTHVLANSAPYENVLYGEASQLIRGERQEILNAGRGNLHTNTDPSQSAPLTYLEGPLEPLSAAIEQSPLNPDTWIRRSRWHLVRQNWKEARVDCEQYLQLKPDNMWVRREHLDICMALEEKDTKSYHVVAEYVRTLPSGRFALGDLRSLCLIPTPPEVAPGDLASWAARSGHPKTISANVYLPAVHYRAGDWQTCAAAAAQTFPNGPQGLFQVVPCLFEAAALKQLGKDTEARKKLATIRDFVENGKSMSYPGKRDEVILNLTFDSLHSQIFYREASELILGKREELKAPLAMEIVNRESARK